MHHEIFKQFEDKELSPLNEYRGSLRAHVNCELGQAFGEIRSSTDFRPERQNTSCCRLADGVHSYTNVL